MEGDPLRKDIFLGDWTASSGIPPEVDRFDLSIIIERWPRVPLRHRVR